MRCNRFWISAATVCLAASGVWGHSVAPTMLPPLVVGQTGTFRLSNGAGEVGCTTLYQIEYVGNASNFVSVIPTQGQYVTPDNPMPAETFTTFTVTALTPGEATIIVAWRIDPADTGPNCTQTETQRPTVTVRVTAPPLPGPLTFEWVPGAGQQPVVSDETARLINEIYLRGIGGTPTPVGQPVPTYNILARLNTPITSKVLNDPLTEALLFIGDPHANNQSPCTEAFCPLRGVGGTGINYANPGASDNAGQPVRNVFQGRQLSPNSLVWLGIPFDPPGTAPQRVIRITNIRANANALGVSSTLTPSQIIASISITDTTGASVPVNNPQQTVGIVQPGLSFSVRRDSPATLEQCVDRNTPTSTTPPNFRLRFEEGFPSAYRVRNAGTTAQNPTNTAPQDVPGTIYNTQTGFFNPGFPATNGLSTAGLADFGTRLQARFNNVPAGVRIYVSDYSMGGVQARAAGSPEGPFTPPAPGPAPGIYEVPISGGTATAVWEILNSNPNALDVVEPVVFFSYVANTAANLPALGTSTVNGSFAPISTVTTSSAPAPIPRFVDTSSPRSLFSIARCNTNLLFPFVTNQAEFDTGLAIANTPRDPFGTPPPTGSLVIANHEGGSIDQLDLRVTASTERLMQATSNWLTVNLDQTSTPATAIWEVNAAGLAAGTYQGMITVSSPRASNRLDIPFRLNVLPEGPAFGPYGVGNAGSYAPAAVSPGEAIVVFGRRFGPRTLATLQLDANGRVATTLAGTRVFFDNVPAPMIYAADGQISAFVPFSVAGKRTTAMRIEYNGVRSLDITLPVVDAIPGLLTANQSGGGQGAILNQNLSVNSASNPAVAGEIVFLFGTGAGQTDPPGTDGNPAALPLPRLLLPVKAFVDGREAEVLYAGPAPSLAEGVLQVNLRIPSGVTPRADVPIWITVGDKRSQAGVSIAVR
jgi:uncharacterized protein (TIGR03437 family)